MDEVLHDCLPDAPWMDPAAWRLPGVQPLDPAQWIIRDEAFAGQMALRDRLITGQRDEVHVVLSEAQDAADEALDTVLAAIRMDESYRIGATDVQRPDGVTVTIDRTAPLLTVGRLIQSDLCLMQPGPNGHILTAAILCFPASWMLSEKIGRALPAIHDPVAEYDESLTHRVQRLFDAIHPDRPLWRANALLYHDAALFQPRRECDAANHSHSGPDGAFLRSERQTLRRLPRTGAVAFGIHTRVVRVSRLTEEQRISMIEARIGGVASEEL